MGVSANETARILELFGSARNIHRVCNHPLALLKHSLTPMCSIGDSDDELGRMLGVLRFWFTKDLVGFRRSSSLKDEELTKSIEIRQRKAMQTLQLCAWRVLSGM